MDAVCLGCMGPGMRQVVGFGDRSMGGGNLGGGQKPPFFPSNCQSRT